MVLLVRCSRPKGATKRQPLAIKRFTIRQHPLKIGGTVAITGSISAHLPRLCAPANARTVSTITAVADWRLGGWMSAAAAGKPVNQAFQGRPADFGSAVANRSAPTAYWDGTGGNRSWRWRPLQRCTLGRRSNLLAAGKARSLSLTPCAAQADLARSAIATRSFGCWPRLPAASPWTRGW